MCILRAPKTCLYSSEANASKKYSDLSLVVAHEGCLLFSYLTIPLQDVTPLTTCHPWSSMGTQPHALPPSSLVVSRYWCSYGSTLSTVLSPHFLLQISNHPQLQLPCPQWWSAEQQLHPSLLSSTWMHLTPASHHALSITPTLPILLSSIPNRRAVTSFLYSHLHVSMPRMTSASPWFSFPVLTSFCKMVWLRLLQDLFLNSQNHKPGI